MWTKSACVVLAWGSILLIVVVTAGMSQPARRAQASIRTTSKSTEITGATAVRVAAMVVTALRPAPGYAVQPGQTLSGIAAALAVPGGWPALYAANRARIGPDPDVIRPGTVLAVPGRAALARYLVAAGDTLAAIAAALAVRGGWPALYAANRPRIGPDPGVIRPGTVLVIPRPAAPRAPVPGPGRRLRPPPPGPAPGGHRPLPSRTVAAAGAGMPRWLTGMLLAAGLVIGAAFLAEPALLIRRRRRAAAAAAGPPGPARQPVLAPTRVPAQRPDPGRGAGEARIVLADYDRVVVTYREADGTVYVLRPAGAGPGVILRAARLVLPEGPYRELAGRLGMPASWPIVLADHDRLIVLHSPADGTVYVLRPPGEDPRAILRAARLVLPEDPYQELADQLGVPAGLPMG